MRLGRDGRMIPERPEGHRSLGYCGTGNYHCQCGEVFRTGRDVPFVVADPHADVRDTPGIAALHEQWDAHCEEVRRGHKKNES